jgi:hypothetical protein
MRVDCALLCDAATVRDGLLHVLGGGVTRMKREGYPAGLGADIGLRIMLHPTEADGEHTLQVILLSTDGAQVANLTAQFSVQKPDDLQPGEEVAVAVPLPVRQFLLPAPGNYSFELLVDHIHQTSLPFIAS